MPETSGTVEISGDADIYVEISDAATEVNVELKDESPVISVEVESSGPPGQGIPEGGRTGQYLRKASIEDYAGYWGDLELPHFAGVISGDEITVENVPLDTVYQAYNHGLPIFLSVQLDYNRVRRFQLIYASRTAVSGMLLTYKYSFHFAGVLLADRIGYALFANQQGTAFQEKTISGSLSLREFGADSVARAEIGDLNELETTAKEDLVSAINEVAQGSSGTSSVKIPKGELDNTSTATVMTATVSGITELADGVCVWLTNGVITSESGVTLNINNLGAKPIYQSQAAATAITTQFNVNYTALLVYNSSRVTGGCWDYVYGYETNTTYTPVKLGFGYATCDTAAATAAKTAALSSYTLTSNGIVSIKFTNDVPANATLNINSKGAKAIYYKGAAIAAGVIKAGDTATFIYSTYYHLVSIDRVAEAYTLPSGGIPSTDLAQSVQDSLDLADSALQSFTETDPTVPSWAKAVSKPSYTASEVTITDAGGYFPTDTVENALQAIGAELAGINTLIGTGVIS